MHVLGMSGLQITTIINESDNYSLQKMGISNTIYSVFMFTGISLYTLRLSHEALC